MHAQHSIKYQPISGIYKRRITEEVYVGDKPLGDKNPIRLQSMTNTPTRDIQATVEQCIRIIQAGGDYVRITAPAIKDAELLAEIKSRLMESGYTTPIIADIHYSPKAAEIAARHVDKIRINPGNFADKKKFAQLEYTDEEYAAEIQRIETRFLPLIRICKQHSTAMRIGVNHGSLSDRIMSRYGDTPHGMAESAMEFLRICKKHQFNQVVVSMKASNTLVMIQANRMLASMMDQEEIQFPIHLGVTEAGEGEDGRLKSAIGIGSLLLDGIGDTVRVSLTEPPEKEIPVAKKIIDYSTNQQLPENVPQELLNPIDPFTYARRKTHTVRNIGGDAQPIVIASYHENNAPMQTMQELGFQWNQETKSWNASDHAPDYLLNKNELPTHSIPGQTKWIIPYPLWKTKARPEIVFPLFSVPDYLKEREKVEASLVFVKVSQIELSTDLISKLALDKQAVLILEKKHLKAGAEQKLAFIQLMQHDCKIPVVINGKYSADDPETFQVNAAIDTGTLFIDGLGDGLWIEHTIPKYMQLALSTTFGILQASRVRISKPEYISCPGCGRTLFNLEDTVARIKAKTNHLKGLKIGIMGCIVNGIGEMADADYGYVGAGPGKITLYKNKEVVQKNLPEQDAVEALIELIKANGDWKERTG